MVQLPQTILDTNPKCPICSRPMEYKVWDDAESSTTYFRTFCPVCDPQGTEAAAK